ncbi:serine/threonine-protein kinase [Paenibacillus oceani]|uniref:Serine/threonine protein kinase n=1 Tax=Paenibacillus oceani TaxID=2772510 RepID=A0A927C6W7_9BACL|nr:serine/threonine-protein kinase [Paenibacillus oceani]MBD2862484.1 serine/threonine protein kinase [Paenibacillus oceani]
MLTDLKVTELSFKLIENIGAEGLNSNTFIAQDLQLDATLVIKQVEKQRIPADSTYFNEARLLYLSKHPNVMEIQYGSQDDKYIYLAMPYLKNGSLNALIDRKFLSVREIVQYGLDFLSAIHYIHTKGLIHFDIKPSNIIINDAGKAVLTDFGLAKLTDSYGFAKTSLVYPTHLTPELFMAGSYTSQYDIFQAGLTLYRMCNGNKEFVEKFKSGVTPEEVLAGTFPDRNKYLPHIPNSLRKIIKNALKINPDDRYKAILHMMNDLSDVCENLDWLYEIDLGTNIQKWTEDNENSVRSLNLYELNGEWKTEGYKFTKSSGNTNRINKWFSTSRTLEEAYTKIETILYER